MIDDRTFEEAKETWERFGHQARFDLQPKWRIVARRPLSMGSLTASVVHPREVYKPAVLTNAAAIICGHNHPSGDSAPSQEDRLITRKLVLAGEALGIKVLDHVILNPFFDPHLPLTFSRATWYASQNFSSSARSLSV